MMSCTTEKPCMMPALRWVHSDRCQINTLTLQRDEGQAHHKHIIGRYRADLVASALKVTELETALRKEKARAEQAERERDEVWQTLCGIDLGKKPVDLVGDMLRDPQNRHTFLKAWKEDMRALLAEGEQAERDLAAARAQVTDLCAERDGAVAIGSQLERKIAAARAEAARLRDSLAEACDLAEEGWAYAGEYLNEKWDTKNQIAGLRAALAPETQPDATPETK
jgi:hypothetical protein